MITFPKIESFFSGRMCYGSSCLPSTYHDIRDGLYDLIRTVMSYSNDIYYNIVVFP